MLSKRNCQAQLCCPGGCSSTSLCKMMNPAGSAEPNAAPRPSYIPTPTKPPEKPQLSFPWSYPFSSQADTRHIIWPSDTPTVLHTARKFAFLLAADTKGLKLFWDKARTFLQTRQYIMLGCIEDAKIFCESTKKWLTCLYIHGSHLCNITLISTVSKVLNSSPCCPKKLWRSFGFNIPGYVKWQAVTRNDPQTQGSLDEIPESDPYQVCRWNSRNPFQDSRRHFGICCCGALHINWG